jgi:hypothetical protein
MHGKGILYYASGTPAYDGEWFEDKFEGFGVLYNENPEDFNEPFDYNDFDLVEELWERYDGEFRDDNKVLSFIYYFRRDMAHSICLMGKSFKGLSNRI